MMSPPFRDADVRRLLHDALEASHAADPSARILHELSIPRPSARADVVALNGEICGFEIKSDVDSLTRLPRQVRAYGAVFDRASVVTTEMHAESMDRYIPYWWGLSVINKSLEKPSIVSIRHAECNPYLNNEALLYLFFVQEIRIIGGICGLEMSRAKLKKDDYVRTILSQCDEYKIRRAAIETLKSRAVPKIQSSGFGV